MNDSILTKFNLLREFIAQNEDGFLTADIEPGIQVTEQTLISAGSFQRGDKGINDYLKMLAIFNGGHIGDFGFAEFENLGKCQFPLIDWEGQYARWLIIGTMLHQLIAIDKQTGLLVLDDCYDEKEPLQLGTMEDFFREYIFGPKYQSIVPASDDDRWVRYIKANS